MTPQSGFAKAPSKPRIARTIGHQGPPRETSLDRLVDSIEKSSRSPFGSRSGRNFGHSVVDEIILEGLIGPDELDYEKQSMRTYTGKFLKSRPDKVTEDNRVEWGGDGRSLDFRDHIDSRECSCGCRCNQVLVIEGCTLADLLDVSATYLATGVIKLINHREVIVGWRRVQVFDIVTTVAAARDIGWLD